MGYTVGQQIGINAISQGIGGVLGLANSALQHKYNKSLASYQYDKNLEMWDKQNAYNSPTAQRERLEDAGLNPALMYGGGSVSTGNASQMPQYQQQGVDLANNMMTAMQMMQMASNIRKTEAEVKQTEAQTEGQSISNQYASRINEATINQMVQGTEKDRALTQKTYEEIKLFPIQAEQMRTSIQSLQEDIKLKIETTAHEGEKKELTMLLQSTELLNQFLTSEKISNLKKEGKQIDAQTWFQEWKNDFIRVNGYSPDSNLQTAIMSFIGSVAQKGDKGIAEALTEIIQGIKDGFNGKAQNWTDFKKSLGIDVKDILPNIGGLFGSLVQ